MPQNLQNIYLISYEYDYDFRRLGLETKAPTSGVKHLMLKAKRG